MMAQEEKTTQMSAMFTDEEASLDSADVHVFPSFLRCVAPSADTGGGRFLYILKLEQTFSLRHQTVKRTSFNDGEKIPISTYEKLQSL